MTDEKYVKLTCVDCGKDISDCYGELKLMGMINDTNIEELNKIIRCSGCHYMDT